MKKITPLILVGLVLILSLSGCGRSKEFGMHASDQGYMPEAFVPADAGLVISYSLRDADQFEAVRAIEASLGDDGRVERTFSEGLASQFGDSDLSYEEDLLPAFGEQYRVVFASRTVEGGDGQTEVFSITTLEDPAKLEDVLKGLVDDGQLVSK